MKLVCFILLLGCSICFGEDKELEKSFQKVDKEDNKCVDPKKCPDSQKVENSKGYGDSINKNGNGVGKKDFGIQDNFDDDYQYVGNPDFDAEIERPCTVYDLNCIRKFFAKHSKCKISRGPLPESVVRTQYTLYFARTNLSTTLMNVRLGGFRNTRIEEFYINRRTNKMVFSIQMRNLTANIPTVYFQYYRNGREPIVTVTDSASVYSTIVFTAVIPFKDEIQLDKAEITTFVEALPAFYIGAEAASVPDPVVIQSLTEFYADLPTDAQELMLTESQFYPPLYIQYNICDFGLKLN